MLFQLRSRDEVANTGWLRASHHFAIAPYGNPAHKPVGHLIVFNDDEIAPRAGIRAHANIEIVILMVVTTG